MQGLTNSKIRDSPRCRDPCLRIRDRDQNFTPQRDVETLCKDCRDFEIGLKVCECQDFGGTILHP